MFLHSCFWSTFLYMLYMIHVCAALLSVMMYWLFFVCQNVLVFTLHSWDIHTHTCTCMYRSPASPMTISNRHIRASNVRMYVHVHVNSTSMSTDSDSDWLRRVRTAAKLPTRCNLRKTWKIMHILWWLSHEGQFTTIPTYLHVLDLKQNSIWPNDV